ncbi:MULTISPECIES: hypothetical protein [unclassified Streptomyces]|uniref:hypothetical protein n=1 Tax=unclassified Streptomyces TaxID=2593676 RepID=UPI002365BB55|nr:MULTISPECIES: hypothetical protein [unclassified Streptomyces]MDF3142917.1 hypothetical protein [Streptomyces sp. T21Q-yed]WDF39234.1 hypothetical protein PBV52_21730 [Streptomyces sp. T12]
MTKFDQVQTSKLPTGYAQLVLSPEHLFNAPLPDLLSELGVTLDESSITDPNFTGAAVVTRDHRVILSMRAGQPDCERDVVARALLGRVLNVPLSPLPEPYRMSEV